jgi:PTH1 family peptidyl-tRNA hydrolase
MSIQLIVGLGNPGKKYESTRHNAGAWFVEQLANLHQKTLSDDKKLHGLSAKIIFENEPLYLLTPTTFMNLSGAAVQAAMQFYKLTPENILIVHDELDVAVGTARLKFGGGHGGHNGLRDIFEKINTKDFYRLRIGIGRPTGQQPVVDYVLRSPVVDERNLIDSSIDRALKILPEIVRGQMNDAMKQLHTEIDRS